MKRVECGYLRYLSCNNIRAELMKRGMSMAMLAKKIGVSAEAVSSTVLGKRHCPQVLDALKEYGVPEEYIYDLRQPRKAA